MVANVKFRHVGVGGESMVELNCYVNVPVGGKVVTNMWCGRVSGNGGLREYGLILGIIGSPAWTRTTDPVIYSQHVIQGFLRFCAIFLSNITVFTVQLYE